MRRAWPRWKTLLVLPLLLGAGACVPVPGEEPLYVLRDSLGRAVAMADRSQLGAAAPGTMLRANITGMEQDVMVGERVGQVSVLAPRPAAPPHDVVAPVEVPPEAAPAGAITTAPLDPPAAETGAPGNRRAGAEAMGNPRLGRLPAAVSGSMM